MNQRGVLLTVGRLEIFHVILLLCLFFTSSALLARQYETNSLIFLDRDILSSDDIFSCSTQEDMQNILSQGQSLSSSTDLINDQRANVKANWLADDLLGFPLTRLNQTIIIRGVVTHLPGSGETPLDRMNRKNVLAGYRLSNITNRVQARVTSDDESCFLTLVYCNQGGDCLNEEGRLNIYTQFPILGFSKKHQVIIIDPSLFGRYLSDQITSFPIRHPLINEPQFISKVLTGDSQSSIVDFSQETLIFDVTSTINWSKVHFEEDGLIFRDDFREGISDEYLSEITSRWAIKFNKDVTENNFIARAPIDGIETLNVYSILYGESVIQKWRLVDDSGNPRFINYYVKNVPEMWQSSFREGFEYWNSISIELRGSPIFTYKFIQGDYDGQQEIITGDIRFNVLEWDTQYKQRYLGTASGSYDKTGEALHSSILIQGPRLVDEYQRWFRYSQMIRAGEPIEDVPLSANRFERDMMKIVSQVDLLNQTKTHLQVLQLAPANETFEDYMSGYFRLLVAHELGHPLGLGHYYMANIYAQDGYIGNSVMDLAGSVDRYKPSSIHYDRKAIAYIYLGILPDFDQEVVSCSRRNLVTLNLMDRNIFPECSDRDATDNPLENFARELQETFNLLTEIRDSQVSPYLIWNGQVEGYVRGHILGVMSYYTSADFSYDKLQSVLIEGRSPVSPQELKQFVLEKYITPLVCRSISMITKRNFPTQSHPQTFSDRLIQTNLTHFQRIVRSGVLPYLDEPLQCPDIEISTR